MATSTETPEPRRAETKSSSQLLVDLNVSIDKMIIELRTLSNRSQAHLDLDVSIEKMITGLRIISSRTQGRPVKGSVERDTKKIK